MILQDRGFEIDLIDCCDACEKQGYCNFLKVLADVNVIRRVIIIQECDEQQEYVRKERL